jgi:hypothetical protein
MRMLPAASMGELTELSSGLLDGASWISALISMAALGIYAVMGGNGENNNDDDDSSPGGGLMQPVA